MAKDDDNGRHLEAVDDEPQTPQEMFPAGSLHGDGVTPQTLIKRGLPIEVTVALSQAEVPMQAGGLIDPNKQGRALVTYAFWKNVEVPIVEDGKIKGWKVRQMLRPVYVRQANDEAELVRQEFANLIAHDARQASALLDVLNGLMADALAPA